MTRGQLGFVFADDMPDVVDESNIAGVFQVWADRIADVNETIARLAEGGSSVTASTNQDMPTT